MVEESKQKNKHYVRKYQKKQFLKCVEENKRKQ